MRDINFIMSELIKKGYDVKYDNGHIKDGKIKEAIIFHFENEPSPVIYVGDSAFEDYCDADMVDAIIDIAERNRRNSVDSSFFTSWDKVKDYVETCVTNINNVDSEVITKRISSDIVKYVRIILPAKIFNDEKGTGTVVVRKSMLKAWGITAGRLFEEADKNIKYSFEVSDFFGMTVFSNFSKTNGAVHAFTPYSLSCLAREIETKEFYIIPSSIHEVLIFDSNVITAEDLKPMVKEVNNTEVEEKDRLSYSIYKYNDDIGYLEEI